MPDRQREEHIKRTLEKLKSIENMVGQPFYDLNQEEQMKVEVLKDESISPAKFKPHPQFVGVFLANSLTIRAMKKDVFVMADSLEELHTPYVCPKCKESMDQQFWYFCPFCGANFER